MRRHNVDPLGFLLLSSVLLSCFLGAQAGEAIVFPAPFKLRPDNAQAFQESGHGAIILVLRNNVLEARWELTQGVLRPAQVVNKLSQSTLPTSPTAFALVLNGSSQLRSDMFRAKTENFQLMQLRPDADTTQPGPASAGWRAEVELHPDSSLGEADWHVVWSAELRDGSNYLRLALELQAGSSSLSLQEVFLYDGQMPESEVAGTENGVPVTSQSFFVGLEHPQSSNKVTQGSQVRCSLQQNRTIDPGNKHQHSLVLGIAHPGQMRRSFLRYIERERAHPTRPMLHYNSWYDIGTGTQFKAADAMDRLDRIGSELFKRNASLDAFLLDDGWDDPDRGPWEPHEGFGKASVAELLARVSHWKASLGLWFSPFGGYHEPRQRRLAAAKSSNIAIREETRDRIPAEFNGHGACSEANQCKEGHGGCKSNQDCEGNLECWQTDLGISPPGVDMSGLSDKTADICFNPGVQSGFLGLGIPAYYAHLRDKIVGWLKNGTRLLKLDGIGNPSGLEQTRVEDFDAAVGLIAELRKVSRSIFINLSTGTWPSPFWLLYSDTVWRRGHDHYFSGPEGPARERWITYRDAMVYKNVVRVSPLFPLNSLMVHGVIFAQDAWDLNKPEGSGSGLSSEPFKHEVRSAFGSGNMLQELYLTPSLLSRENWDDIAVASRWVRPRMQTLADVQWFGGDPDSGHVYGWAAWRDEAEDEPASAVLTLRNPSPTRQTIQLDAALVFRLPDHALRSVIDLNSPFSDQRPRRLHLWPHSDVTLTLAPFSVLVFDSAAPAPHPYADYFDIFWDYSAMLFWTILAAAAALTWMRNSSPSGAPVPPVPVEELRRRRLEALQRRSSPADQR